MSHLESPTPTSAYRFAIGEIICDISEGTIETNSELFRLEPRLCGVLALLVQRGSTTITRDEFLETVWDNEGSDEALTQAISRLRKLLGDPAFIETVPRIGYRLTVAAEVVAANHTVQSQSLRPRSFQSLPLGAVYIGFAILIVGTAAFWLGTQHNAKPEPTFEVEIEVKRDVDFHKLADG